VVEASVADVIGPAVTSDDPYRLLDELVGQVSRIRMFTFRPEPSTWSRPP